MAGRQRATFQKRQREVKRLEKQRTKLEKRAARRMDKAQRAPQESPGFAPIREDEEVSEPSEVPGHV